MGTTMPTWAKRVTEAWRRLPRLARLSRAVATGLVVGWMFVIGALLEALQGTRIDVALTAWADRHPAIALLVAVGAVLSVTWAISLATYRIHHLTRALSGVIAAEDLPAGARPGAVYLRPFDVDQQARPSIRQRLAVMNEDVLANREEQLAQVLAPLGPFVAIGRPGETLPTPGAVRRYVDDAHWKAQVDEWLRAARLVILVPGRSAGVQWELREALETVPPEALLIAAWQLRKPAYVALQSVLNEAMGLTLPPFAELRRHARVDGFFAFDERRRPVFLPLAAPWFRVDPWEPSKARLQHAMKPVLQRLGVPWQPAPISRWRVGLLAFAGVLLVALALVWAAS
jgi:hypothetical protein